MPYDPGNTAIICAKHEYHVNGNNGVGMKKNANTLMDDVEAGNAAGVVWYCPDSQPLKGVKGRGDEILIRGHGMAGLASIEGGRGGERVSCAEIAKRLKKSGLSKSFAGKIKCFSCHSAESAAPGVAGAEGPPFAQVLAGEMRKLGFKSCTYYGYLGAIDSYAKLGSAGKAYYARPSGTGGQGPELGTLSMATVQFHV